MSPARRFAGFTAANQDERLVLGKRPRSIRMVSKASSRRSRRLRFLPCLLQQMSGTVVLSWTPEVAAQLAGHAAKVMPAATGGFRGAGGGHRHASGDRTSRASPLYPSRRWASRLVGRLLSLVVAQKHLCDINARLDQIERKVDELRDLLDADLVAEMRGDAEHLLTIVRAFRPSSDQPAPSGLEHTVDQIVRSCAVPPREDQRPPPPGVGDVHRRPWRSIFRADPRRERPRLCRMTWTSSRET